MHWDVTEVRVEDRETLFVRFADGLAGRVRFGPEFFSGVFTPLRDADRFGEAFVDHGAVCWPGDLDLAPDAMHEEIARRGEMLLTGHPEDVTA